MSCRGCKRSLHDLAVITADDSQLWCFLLEHHVLSDIYFCDVCFKQCRNDSCRQRFRCDRQVTVKLHGGRTKVTKKHSFSRSLLAGTWFDKQKFSKKIICRFCSCLILGVIELRGSYLLVRKAPSIGALSAGRFVCFG